MKPSPLELLVNPFRYIAGGQALTLATLLLVLESVASWKFGVGMTSLQHRQYIEMPYHFHLAVAAVNWLCLFLAMLLPALFLSRSTFRIIDLAGTLALSRWPAQLSPLLLAPPAIRDIASKIVSNPAAAGLADERLTWMGITLVTIIMMLFAHWLAWKAFAVSCNVQASSRSVLAFIGGVLLASIASFLANGYLIDNFGKASF